MEPAVHRSGLSRDIVRAYPGAVSMLATLAIFAMLQPALASFFPHLAGWQPGHGHVYASADAGLANSHTHPYETQPSHAHEQRDDAAPSITQDGDVVFLFADDATGAALAPAVVPALVPPQVHIEPVAAIESHLTSVPAAPTPPPPRT